MLTNYGRDIILDMDEIDEKDPTGTYSIGSFNPSFVGNCPFDPVRRYVSRDEMNGEAMRDEN